MIPRPNPPIILRNNLPTKVPITRALIIDIRQNVAVAITGWSVYYIITQKKWNNDVIGYFDSVI